MLPERRMPAIILLGCGLCFGQEQQIATRGATFAIKTVKGMPFSAKVITESTQPLLDGNRIARTSSASIARDSEGRTRREQVLPLSGNASVATVSIVFIQDPATGSAYVL